jgi:hypothetical protein
LDFAIRADGTCAVAQRGQMAATRRQRTDSWFGKIRPSLGQPSLEESLLRDAFYQLEAFQSL